MARLEILTEEPSMAEVLKIILPKILPERWVLGENYFVRKHEGKSDLQLSIPKKIKAFSHFSERVGVVVLHDQDAHDCKNLKKRLVDLCAENGDCPVLVRIVCKELEAWYLGDMAAVQMAYPKFKAERLARKSKFRNPDELNASDELEKLLPEFQKIASAKAIAPHLKLDEQNKSVSFRHFLKGIVQFSQTFESDF